MNRLGMLINISHASDETMEQAIEISSDPLVATHHGLRSFNNIPRTMPDSLLKKLAARGGVIGFHIGNEFHNVKMFEWRSKQAGKPFWDTSAIGNKEASLSIEAIDRLVAPKFPMVGFNPPEELLMTVDDWVNVVDRAIQVAGEDHVALGSDFDGGPTPPRGIRDVRDLALGHRRDAAPGLLRGPDPEISGRQSAPSLPASHGKAETSVTEFRVRTAYHEAVAKLNKARRSKLRPTKAPKSRAKSHHGTSPQDARKNV